MPKRRRDKLHDPLVRLVSAADKDVLAGLILALAGEEPEVRRSCFEYLKKHVALPMNEQGKAEGEAVMALWLQYEPLILKPLDKAWDVERLKIFMHRKNFEQALAVLKKIGSPGRRYYDRDALKVAQALEERFPREILAYYRSGLGDLKINRTRKDYADQAAIMAKTRHMFVDVLKAPQEWEAFARPVKAANIKRPAFQEEMARAVPDWKDL